ncbi:EscU/YscU/HrcU family type III secretion system export apparatus switch protein [Aestuariispira insulae]|uniref:Flagellar biosynthesis protein n=1 Tax=Aestuariispira insulae TaxID=1461337 RepID=A0A3D9HSJ4_9PROT|nr:EscU/YscU/HrcU family type III secretion system export apparatus switch protein [Aestuariispira insulae]RED52472.1 flagellar biosynthesis protein [Aestuariispira insulae]
MAEEEKDGLENLLGTPKAAEEAKADIASKGESTNDSVAVALSYDPADRDSAPSVVASGKGSLAERILEKAAEHGVPIHKDADLVSILAATEVGEEIPVEAFIAVAEILRFVYAANGRKLTGG